MLLPKLAALNSTSLSILASSKPQNAKRISFVETYLLNASTVGGRLLGRRF